MFSLLCTRSISNQMMMASQSRSGSHCPLQECLCHQPSVQPLVCLLFDLEQRHKKEINVTVIQSNELESSKTQIFKLLKLALSDIINIDTKINAYILNSSDLFCMSQPFIACICAVTIPNSYHTSESSMRTCKYIRKRQSFVQCDAVIIKFYVVFTQHVSDK